MKFKPELKASGIIFLFLLLSVCANSQEVLNKRAEWFVDARYGMFIHWGVYSGAEGVWKGEKHRNDNNYAEWIQYRNRIDKIEYLSLLDRFRWDQIDPEKWVILAKNAGMKYVVITAKHHDGFALWDSKASTYDVSDYTNPKRDIIKELAAACKKHGLKLGLYYSHWIDWEHQYGWDHTKAITGITPENYNKYWQEKVIPQMRELLTGYGPISVIWFDMWIHYSGTVVTKEQLLQLKSLIRELQPNCLVNSRLGLSIEEDSDVDFKELGDNQLGNKKSNYPWQSPATVADSWGFNRLDYDFKSTTTLLHSIISNVSLNGNFLLNIGPKSNGDVPYEISQRLLEAGEWLKVNGESVYGSGASDVEASINDWGRITSKRNSSGRKLFFNIFTYPYNNRLSVTGITTRPARVYLLSDKNRTPLTFSHNEALLTINLPDNQPDPYVTVVAAEYDTAPETITGVVGKTIEGGYSFTPSNIVDPLKALKLTQKQRGGTIPAHIVLNGKTNFKWKIYADQAGPKSFDVSYSYQGSGTGNSIALKAAGSSLSHSIVNTGKTVGEPNADWVIEDFKSQRIGTINFPSPGYYEIELEIIPALNDEVKFQWLWLK
jgi:alpha-L-fucosidase